MTPPLKSDTIGIERSASGVWVSDCSNGGTSCSRSRSLVVRAPLSFALPCRSRSLVALSLLILLTFFASLSAQAQGGYPGGGGGGYPGGGGGGYPGSADSYSVTYSGGTVTANGIPSSYGGINSSNAPGAWGGGTNIYIPGGGSGSITCAGQITATFTWNGGPNNDPPPPANSVIVAEVVNAAWSGQGSSGGSDLGPGTTPISQPPNYTAARYSLQGGGTFTVSCNPSAFMSGSSPNPYQVMGGSAYVGYTATATPALTLTGGIGSTWNKSLLIGQQLSATLNTAGLQANPCNWTVSGGSPFANYNQVAGNNNATYTPLGSLTGTSMNCYFASPTTAATVTCTAHLVVPANASPSAGLNISLSPSLTIEKPSNSLNIVIGSVNPEPGYPSPPTFVELEQYPQSQPSGSACGLQFFGTITTPAAYVASGDYGLWNWTQIIKASRLMKNNGVYWQFAVQTTNPSATTKINNWPILDGSYPYSGWYPPNGNTYNNADSPWQGLDSSTAIREYDVSDSFQDFLMYQPPGVNSLPFP